MEARQRPKEKAVAKPEQEVATSHRPSLCLEALVGFSCSGTSCVAHHAASSALFYTAGSTVVLYDLSTRSQVAYFHSKSGKPLACVASSRCGKYVAAGERGSNPSVHVFEVVTGRCVANLGKAHKYGIASLSFSPDGRLLASTGMSSDGQVCIWDWHSGSLLGKQHTRALGVTACFTEDGSCVVTAGKEHFKAWSLSQPASRGRSNGTIAAAGAAAGGGLLLAPKPASLKEYKNSTFVSIQSVPGTSTAAPSGSGLYALTSSGVLLLMRATGRTIDKSVNVQVKQAHALAVSSSLVACACSAGVVRVFATRTLAFKCNLPRPAAKASLQGQNPAADGVPPAELYPDAVACSFSPGGTELSVMYDHSIIVWDTSDLTKVSALRCLMAHAGGIWDAVLLPRLAQDAAAGGGAVQPLEVVSCSEDGLIRFWGVQQGSSRGTIPLGAPAPLANAQAKGPSSGLSPLAPGTGLAARCLATSPDGCHLAVGDDQGNLRVFDTQSLSLLVMCEAHDTEMLSLCFSPLGFLATGGRDGMIHIFDCCQNYALLHTLDEHGGAAVTAVRFSRCGTRLLSCGADRAVVFRSVVGKNDCTTTTHHREQLPQSKGPSGSGPGQALPPPSPGGGSGRGVLYDLALDASGLLAVTVGQDGAIRLFDVEQHRAVGVLWQEQPKDAAGASSALAVRIALDPSGSLAFCACADGSMAVYDLPSKQLLARSEGRHAGVATAVMTTEDVGSVLSVGSDGCVMQWAVPQQLVARVAAWVAANPQHQRRPLPTDRAVMCVPDDAVAAATDALKAAPRRQAWGAALPAAIPSTGEVPATPAAAQASDAQAAVQTEQGGNTLMRLQQGKPLLSADKLPRWARRLPLPSFDVPADQQHQQDSPMPDASVVPSKSGPQGDGVVWVARPGLSKLGQQGKVTPLSAAGVVAVVAEEEEEEVVVCQPDMGPDACFEVQGAAEGEGDAGEPEEAAAGQEGDDCAAYAADPAHKGAAGGGFMAPESTQPEDLLASVGASNFVPGDGFGMLSPGAAVNDGDAPGAAALRRDLFREHFDNLDQVSVTSAAGGQDGDGQDSRRLSLTAAYRKKALALLRAEQEKAQGDMAAVSGPAASPGPGPSLSPLASAAVSMYVTATRGSGQCDVDDVLAAKGLGTPAWPPSACNNPLAGSTPGTTPAAGVAAAGAGGAGAEVQSGLRASQALVRPASPYRQLSPHRRAGQLSGELAKMRERLEGLQQQFDEQNKRASPWKQQRGQQQQQPEGGQGLQAETARPAAVVEVSLAAISHQQGMGTPLAVSTAVGPAKVPAAQPAVSTVIQDNPMFNSTPTAISNGSPGGFAFGDGPAVVAFSNAMYGGVSPAVTAAPAQQGEQGKGCRVMGGDSTSEITLAGIGRDALTQAPIGLVSPSNCTIRKKAKVTLPGFKSRLSPSSNKFTSMAELSSAMAAESAGARAVPSAIAAESGRAAQVPSAMRTPPPRKLRTAEEYRAALLRLNSAAAEVAELWGELQVDTLTHEGAADSAETTPGFAEPSFAPSSSVSQVSNLQAQLQQGVGKSLQTLAVVLGTSAVTPLSINGPACD